MNTFAIGSLPVHFSVAKLFNFRWQYTQSNTSLELVTFINMSLQTFVSNGSSSRPNGRPPQN